MVSQRYFKKVCGVASAQADSERLKPRIKASFFTTASLSTKPKTVDYKPKHSRLLQERPAHAYISPMLSLITLITGRQPNGLPTWVNKDCTNLACTNLSNRNLKGIKLAKTDFFKTNLKKTNFRGANLSYAYLVQANLENSDLRQANLRGANLRSASLKNAKTEGADFRFAIFDDETVLPFSKEEAMQRGMVLSDE